MAKIVISGVLYLFLLMGCLDMGTDVERMHNAVKRGDVARVKALLKDGVSANIKNEKDTSPMELAVVYGCFECLEELIKNGGDVNETDKRGEESLIFLSLSQHRFPYLKLLVKNGAEVNTQDSMGYTPLISAIVLSQYDMAEFLLNSGADPTLANNTGKTPLDYLREDKITPEFEQYEYRKKVRKIILLRLSAPSKRPKGNG
ncbi:ankyrin repeat domain-containing protein [Alteromonas sp. a30]|uniref:ankyrin repeat domain-containing protein n=1 Tax=Alteromonas sp. a30 TaxID=2730917 RepID=UPI002280EBB0|nr:ankyrin repeat domain-containing protein [Alteromonas sp. a30]MCY7297523.1 hypothetical protein [Alteromonas sp. a30]